MELERTRLVLAQHLVFACLMAIPCGPATEASPILEGAARNDLPIHANDLVGRFFRVIAPTV